MKKYQLKEDHYDFQIFFDNIDVLFGFGRNNTEGQWRDIKIFKKGSIYKSYCKQYSYDYNGETNALCDNSNTFEIERILVYEMEETEEMTIKREESEESERQNDIERWKNEKDEIERRINEMTNKEIEEIIFDSEINKWSENDSEFDQKLNKKKDIIILIEDERQNLFGGYIGNEICLGLHILDNSCYVFSLRKDGIYDTKRYERNEKGYSYCIALKSHYCLMSFGMDNSYKCRDIALHKKDYSSGYCQQVCYNYSGEEFALTGKNWFTIKRIVVYQLK